MHLPYCLHCSVCQTELWSKFQWFQHLSTEKHQSLAREQCVREWGSADEAGTKMIQRCLLIFSSFPVTPSSGGAFKIIQHFSKKLGVFVTDFVCWEERPFLAVLQFESGKIAKEVFSGVTDSELMLDNQPAQIRLGSDFRHLEWSALFSMHSTPNATSRRSLTSLMDLEITLEPQQEKEANCKLTSILNGPGSPPVPKKVKMTTPSTPVKHFVKKFGSVKQVVSKLNQFVASQGWPPPDYKFDMGSKTKPTWSCTIRVNGVKYSTQFPNKKGFRHKKKEKAKLVAAFLCLQTLRKEVARVKRKVPSLENNANSPGTAEKNPLLEQLELPQSPIWTSNQGGIQNLFREVLASVTVPDSTYNSILEMAACLQSLFRQRYPNVVVVPFRHFHLRLTNPDVRSLNEVLLFCHNDQPNSEPIPVGLLHHVFGNAQCQQHFSVVQAPDKEVFQMKLGGTYRHLKTNLEFTLANAQYLIVEVQICRLLEYMITFDSRCHSLIALTFYWTRVNRLSFGNLNLRPEIRRIMLSEPLTTEWLVILFMSYKGLIPSVREIQQRPHIVLRDPISKVDIGFEPDPDYAREWKSHQKISDPGLPLEKDPNSEQFVVSVLKLFQEFLEFYGEALDGGQWILNTRDGEVIRMGDFLREDPGPSSSWQSKMSPTDLFALRVVNGGRAEGVTFKAPEVASNSEDNAVIQHFSKCSVRVDYQQRTAHMVHPFNFTQMFSTHKELNYVFQLMGLSSKQLKHFLGAGATGGDTLEKVLTIETKIKNEILKTRYVKKR